MSRQTVAQKLYHDKYVDAERALSAKGRTVKPSIADQLYGPASKIYALLEKLGGFFGTSEEITYEMVRLAFGLLGDYAKKYVDDMEKKMIGLKDRLK